jgi:GntR family transcriptional repressor for pyruvate dehydrogenase complex
VRAWRTGCPWTGSQTPRRQALAALGQSGHVHAVRGRGGGTFVADPLPPALPPSSERRTAWQDVCDERRAVEVEVAQLAAERARELAIDALDRFVLGMDSALHDFPGCRHLDVRLHVGIAKLTGSTRLVARMTEVQGSMSSLISQIAHPPEVLDVSNDQHRRLVERLRRRDTTGAVREMAAHTRGTEHVLAGLLAGA